MGLFSKDIKTMHDLFVHQLKDIYYAEKRITGALEKMVSKTTSSSLKQGFQSHVGETQTQIQRLERVFKNHGLTPAAVTCPAIDGIIKEADEVVSETADKQVLDAALIAAAQAVEHYEIARYGALASWADQLGYKECARLLRQSLDEEKATDQKLTKLAETQVNRAAAA